jgi:fructose-1,6-bisphosphatase
VPGGEGKYQKVLADIGSKYVTVFDPLDGSSNVDANIPTGTIFGVYEEAESMENCVLDGELPLCRRGRSERESARERKREKGREGRR